MLSSWSRYEAGASHANSNCSSSTVHANTQRCCTRCVSKSGNKRDSWTTNRTGERHENRPSPILLCKFPRPLQSVLQYPSEYCNPWATCLLCCLRCVFRAVADQVSGATTTAVQKELSSLSGSKSGEEGGASSGSEAESGERRRKRRGASRTAFGPRTLGDVEEEGFTGTRVGYQVQKVREVAGARQLFACG